MAAVPIVWPAKFAASDIDDFEELLRTLANDVHSAINEQGNN